jgi:hypothetical protein
LATAAIVDIMSAPQEPYVDPSGNTEAFKAFVDRGGQPAGTAPKKSATPIAIGSAIAVVVIAIVVWLVAK